MLRGYHEIENQKYSVAAIKVLNSDRTPIQDIPIPEKEDDNHIDSNNAFQSSRTRNDANTINREAGESVSNVNEIGDVIITHTENNSDDDI